MKLQIDIPATDEEALSLFIYTEKYTTIKEAKKIIQFLNEINKKGCVFCNGRHLFLTSHYIKNRPAVLQMNCEDCGFRHEFNLKILLDKSKNLLTPEDKKKRS